MNFILHAIALSFFASCGIAVAEHTVEKFPVVVVFTDGMIDLVANLAHSILSADKTVNRCGKQMRPEIRLLRIPVNNSLEAGFATPEYYIILQHKLSMFLEVIERQRLTSGAYPFILFWMPTHRSFPVG